MAEHTYLCMSCYFESIRENYSKNEIPPVTIVRFCCCCHKPTTFILIGERRDNG